MAKSCRLKSARVRPHIFVITSIPTFRQAVWQNVALALGVKALVLLLGALGVATLWEAVFADVGVALLAILNAIRIQKQIK